MNTDPQQFLDTADDLCQPRRREADYRSSVSRAYYAVFHLVRAALVEKVERELRDAVGLGKNPRHDPLISRLKNSGSTELKKFGIRLEALYTERIRSDYRLDHVVEHHRSRDTLEDAQDLWRDVVAFGRDRLGRLFREDLSAQHGRSQP